MAAIPTSNRYELRDGLGVGGMVAYEMLAGDHPFDGTWGR